jgi:hypothetical protein
MISRFLVHLFSGFLVAKLAMQGEIMRAEWVVHELNSLASQIHLQNAKAACPRSRSSDCCTCHRAFIFHQKMKDCFIFHHKMKDCFIFHQKMNHGFTAVAGETRWKESLSKEDGRIGSNTMEAFALLVLENLQGVAVRGKEDTSK